MTLTDKNSVSRRGFIKTTGTTLAGSMLVSQRNFEDFKRIEFPYVRKGH